MLRLIHAVVGHQFSAWYPLVMHGWTTTGRPEIRVCGCGQIDYNGDGALLTAIAAQDAVWDKP